MAIWAAANAKEVTDYYLKHDLLYLSDRDAELWLPLFAALDVADRTRIADLQATAQRLSGAKSENEPTELGIRLLTDIRQIFTASFDAPEQLPSEALLNRLSVLDESPWNDFGFGKDLNARKLAELLRHELKQLTVQHAGQVLGRISASIGISAFPGHATTAEELLRAADQALYRAKAQGRDRVVVAIPANAREAVCEGACE